MRGLGAAAADRATTAVEEGQLDAVFGGGIQQLHLGMLQAPARGGDTAVLAAVGVTQHHHLHVVARGQMRAVDRIGQQVAQRGGAALQVVNGFEQRRDIQRHGIVRIDQATAARQRQYCQHIAAVMRHRDDVAAQGIGTVATACVGQRCEYLVQALPGFVLATCQHFAAGRIRRQQLRAGDIVQRVERILPAKHFGQRARMHARLLPHIQPRQMEPKRAHPPQQATHREPSGMLALVGFQTVQDQLDVMDEFFRRCIGARRIFHGGLQACTHAVVEQAVRHVGVTRARLHLRQQLLVFHHACQHLLADTDQFGRLAEQAGQRQHVLQVQREHGVALRVQGIGDGAGVHVRIAVHVTAHPGAKTQQAWQRQGAAPGVAQRLLQ